MLLCALFNPSYIATPCFSCDIYYSTSDATTSRHPTMSRGYKPSNPLLIKGTVVVVIVVVVAILAFVGSGGLYQLAAVTVKRASTTVELPPLMYLSYSHRNKFIQKWIIVVLTVILRATY